MRHQEVKCMKRALNEARALIGKLGADCIELRQERDQLRRENAEIKQKHQDLLSWGYELARGCQ
ncbi:MAG: hypothetical protein OXI79_00205 [Gammaproteobacteria bacterium]|nr:hypothetical protein [Gammaproteobacteria bacterium]